MQLARAAGGRVVLPAAAGATAAVFGVISIERRSLWIDEAIDVSLTGLTWGDYLRIAFEREGSQALYLLFLKPWLALTSTNEWVARAPSVAFAALASALLVVLGIRLFRSRLCGFGAGMLLATNAFSVEWSQQVRQYALAMLLAVVVTYLFVQALGSDGWSWWLVYGIVAGVSVYAHFFIGLVLASHVPPLIVFCRSRAVLLRWAVAAGIAFAIALPALNFVLNHDTGQVSWIPEADYDYIRGVLDGVSGESRLALIVCAASLVVLIVSGIGGRKLSWQPILVGSWLVVPFAIALAISSLKPMLLDRYLIVSVPALALAIAYAVSRMGRWPGVVTMTVLVAVALTHVHDWYGSVVDQDWRGAVDYVEQQQLPDDKLFVYPGWLGDPVIYYASSHPDTSDVLGGDRAWVVTLTERAPDVEEWVAGSGYEVKERQAFSDVGVWLVEQSRGG